MLSKEEVESIKMGDFVFIDYELCVCIRDGIDYKSFIWIGKTMTQTIYNLEKYKGIALLDTDESLMIVKALYEQ